MLTPHGRAVLSHLTCEQIPENLREDERLSALCLRGSLSLKEYIKMITDFGFGATEISAKRPYRILDPVNYIFLVALELLYVLCNFSM